MQSKKSPDDTNDSFDTLVVTDIQEFDDGSAQYTFDMSDETEDLIVDAGITSVIDELALQEYLPKNFDELDVSEKAINLFFVYTMKNSLEELAKREKNKKK